VSCYGYGKLITPHLDDLAREGVLFSNVHTPNPFTEPAFTSLYTGMYPTRHGIVSHGSSRALDPAIKLLPEVLGYAGLHTGAVDNLARWKGWFQRGFLEYVDPDPTTAPIHADARSVNEALFGWLERNHDVDFFLVVHYWDPHAPYLPPEDHDLFGPSERPEPFPWRQHLREPLASFFFEHFLTPDTSLEEAIAAYDGEINCVDKHVGDLIGALRYWGILEDTVVIITSDHGESLGEHGIFFDHHGLYETTTRVPLIIYGPGRIPAGIRIDAPVVSVDIPLTLLDLAGIRDVGFVRQAQGRSLLPLVQGEGSQDGGRPIFLSESTWQSKRAILHGKWKLIRSIQQDVYGNPPCELYDLASDPAETRNLYAEHPALAADLEERLSRWVQEQSPNGDPLMLQGCSKRLHPYTLQQEAEVLERVEEPDTEGEGGQA